MTSKSNAKKQKKQGILSLTNMRGADEGIRAKQQIAFGAAGTKGKDRRKLLANNAISDLFRWPRESFAFCGVLFHA